MSNANMPHAQGALRRRLQAKGQSRTADAYPCPPRTVGWDGARGGGQGGGKLIRSEAARPVDFSGGDGEVAGVRECIFAVSVAEEREE